MMNSNDEEELRSPAESNMGIGKFLRVEEPYFPWSANGIRSPFPIAPQQELLSEAASPEEGLDMSLSGFGSTFQNQESLVQPNSIMTNPDDSMPGINSCWTTTHLNLVPNLSDQSTAYQISSDKIINTENLTTALQLPNEVLDPPFPHHIPDYFNSSPGVHRNYYASMQIPWGGNSDFSHPRQIPGHAAHPFQHFPGSPFQVKDSSFSGKLSQASKSKRQRPLMLRWWIDKIVPALEWSKLQSKLLEADHDGGEQAGNGELERSLDAVAQAVNHKMKERIRRSEFNAKMQTLISLVPVIKKKDKVSVLTSTIEYIRELSSAIGMRAPLQKPLPNKSSANLTDDILLRSGEEELVEAGGSSTKVLPTLAADTPSSSTQHPAPDFVFVELACGGDAFNVNLDTETYSPAQVLIRLLKVLKDLHLHLLKIECSSEHGRLNATMSVAMPLDQNMSCDQVREALQRVLDYGSLQSTCSD